jgi:hypothetical protein
MNGMHDDMDESRNPEGEEPDFKDGILRVHVSKFEKATSKSI